MARYRGQVPRALMPTLTGLFVLSLSRLLGAFNK